MQARAQAKDVIVLVENPPCPVEACFDSDLLELALVNLAQNAIDASDIHGRVELRLETSPDALILRTTDNGKGIDPEHLESIFNPFFTTKQEGVGLGLPIVSKIVDEHNGKMTVQSTPGKGTTFEIVLPRQEKK